MDPRVLRGHLGLPQLPRPEQLAAALRLDNFAQRLTRDTLEAMLPAVFGPEVVGLVRTSIRLKDPGADNQRFLPGADHVFHYRDSDPRLLEQLRSYLAYVATVFVGSEGGATGVSGLLGEFCKARDGTVTLMASVQTQSSGGAELKILLDEPPGDFAEFKYAINARTIKLFRSVIEAIGAANLRAAPATTDTAVCRSLRVALSGPVDGESEVDVDDVARWVVQPDRANVRHLQVGSIRDRVDALLEHLDQSAPSLTYRSVTSSKARENAIEDLMARFPIGPLAGYLATVATSQAIYVCPATLVREQHGREEQGSLNILLSEAPSSETIEAIKIIASRLWNGFGLYHTAVAVHRVQEQAKRAATALAAYNVGHTLSRRLDRARTQITRISKSVPTLKDATSYVDQAWRQAELMHLMANVSRFGPHELPLTLQARFCATSPWSIRTQFALHLQAAQRYAMDTDTDLRPLTLVKGSADALRGWVVEHDTQYASPHTRWFDQLYDEVLFEIVDNAQKAAFPEKLGVRVCRPGEIDGAVSPVIVFWNRCLKRPKTSDENSWKRFGHGTHESGLVFVARMLEATEAGVLWTHQCRHTTRGWVFSVGLELKGMRCRDDE